MVEIASVLDFLKSITPPLRSIQNAKNPEILQQMDPLVGVDSVRSILERNTKK